MNVLANLDVLATLSRSPPGTKLSYDNGRQTFKVQLPGVGTSLARTFSRQSVESDEYFAQPIMQLFQQAKREDAAPEKVLSAYHGLEKLRESYAGDKDAKFAAIQKVLSEIKTLFPDLPTSGKTNLADLRQELSKPAVLGPGLELFVRTIYNNSTFMKAPDNLAQSLYNVYTNSPNVRTRSSRRDFMRKLWDVFDQHPNRGAVSKPPFLQNCPYTLKEMVEEKYIADRVQDLDRLYRDFIYFSFGGAGAKFRVYANVTFDGASAFAQALLDAVPSSVFGINSFKITGPSAISSRADGSVIYCESMEQADQLANWLVQRCSHLVGMLTPHMTRRIDPRVGIGIGAEPEYQATGFKRMKDDAPLPPNWEQLPPEDRQVWERIYRKRHADARAQSFGTIRCELVAMAIHNYKYNKSVVGKDTLDNFKRFVATAFRSFGLDPAHPEM